MTKIKYHYKVEDEKKVARASVRNLRISWKHAVMIAKSIKKMPVKKAKNMLERVIALKKPLKYTKFYDSMGHKKDMMAGRYPVNASKEYLKVLNNVENNADEKGMDVDRLIIVNVAANKSGARIPRGRRMFGRRESKSASIQITVMEKEGKEKDEKKVEKKEVKKEKIEAKGKKSKETKEKVEKEGEKVEKSKKQVVKKTKGESKK